MNTYLKTLALACALTSFTFASNEINIDKTNVVKDNPIPYGTIITYYSGYGYVFPEKIDKCINNYINTNNITINDKSWSQYQEHTEIKATLILSYLISHDLIKNLPKKDEEKEKL